MPIRWPRSSTCAGSSLATGHTRLIFTSREPLPEPFAGNRLKIGRLDRPDAIRLVAGVMGTASRRCGKRTGNRGAGGCGGLPRAGTGAAGGRSGRVGCSPRHGQPAPVDGGPWKRKHPGERERSLLASVQLSLRRLPAATRQKMRPLGVFQGGGWLVPSACARSGQKESEDFPGERAGWRRAWPNNSRSATCDSIPRWLQRCWAR